LYHACLLYLASLLSSEAKVILKYWKITTLSSLIVLLKQSDFILPKFLLTYGVHVFACIGEKVANKASGASSQNSDEQEEDLKQLQKDNDRLHILRIDFSKDESVKKLVDYVDNKLGKNFLYAVVNTHGKFHSGSIETTSVKVFEDLFKTNILSTVNIVKAFSQMLRDGKGRIVNFSSAEGRLAYPFHGAFTTTRFALEGFTDTLRTEMRQLDVKVVLVEPCDFRASIGPQYGMKEMEDNFTEMWKNVDDEVKENYGEEYYSSIRQCVANRLGKNQNSDKHVIKVIDAALDALASDIPKDRYLVSSDFWSFTFDSKISKLLVLCAQFLPATILDLWFDLRYMNKLKTPNYLKKK